MGVDIFTNASFRTFELADFEAAQQFDVQAWLREPNTVAVSEEFARRHQLKRGDTLRAHVNGAEQHLRVAFVMRASGAAGFDEHFAAMDIGWAQELLGRRGSLGSIQVQVNEGTDREAVIASLREVLPPDATVTTPAQRGQQVENMLAGFQLNLTAMSLVSLLVGMFLIYNTVSASVVRRRHEIGIMRSLGVTRNRDPRALSQRGGGARHTRRAGRLARRPAARADARRHRLEDNLVALRVAQRPRNSGDAADVRFRARARFTLGNRRGLAAGGRGGEDGSVDALRGGSLIEQAVNLSPAWLWSGVGSVALAAALSFLALTSGPPWLGFGAAFCVLAGFSFLVPSVTLRFSAAAGHLLRVNLRRYRHRLIEANLASANVSRSLIRNSVTIAALAAAVAMAIGVSVMVFSFRRTVESWIDQTLVADLFIAPASNEVAGAASFMPPEAIAALQRNPARRRGRYLPRGHAAVGRQGHSCGRNSRHEPAEFPFSAR
jgi:putative ABC transport system permease protein